MTTVHVPCKHLPHLHLTHKYMLVVLNCAVANWRVRKIVKIDICKSMHELPDMFQFRNKIPPE